MLLTSTALASTEEGDVMGFDQIVNGLNREYEQPFIRSRNPSQSSTADRLESVMFHGGLGVPILMQSLTFSDGKQVFLGQRGFQAAFGIDLFSKDFMAEGTARTFGESDDTIYFDDKKQSVPYHVSLQEFELKIVGRSRIDRRIGTRIAFGLSARYMNVSHGSGVVYTYVTPSGVATAGLDIFMSERMSLGVDVNGRSAMISDTPDRNSYDATLRLDFHL
jgi:hypothetical protein